jgi:hypothetical protein
MRRIVFGNQSGSRSIFRARLILQMDGCKEARQTRDLFARRERGRFARRAQILRRRKDIASG